MLTNHRTATTARWVLLGIVVLLSMARITVAQDPFAQNVRTSPALTPQQQLKTFRLPPGFEVQLFAAEPQIQKPMNMAFDARGRLWVSGSVEYPFAAKEGQGRDTIKVLEDTTGDGQADKVTTFVDGLNIPIGLYPYRNGVIAYSIPNIYFFQDTNGDGKCDKREVLYGPIDIPRDVHGMQNAFRRGFDDWLYICHGFANTSTIKGKDGSQITLQSGNTYRVKLDGSRVEQHTWGQVNPFGMTFTPQGDLFTVDCHSKPLTMLIRGGYYPSFGKPHDGLGFVKSVMEHGHGSTALCGAVYLTGNAFPKEYRGCLLLGNVMTGRVHRDRLVFSGATASVEEKSDLLTTTDPWFRPVDLQFGSDGALYVADFYNRIIGHYEVPLTDPRRDRNRGRIWRVRYRGKNASNSPQAVRPAGLDIDELVATLGHPQMEVRMLAMNQLTDRFGGKAKQPLQRALRESTSGTSRVHALWTLHRIKALDEAALIQATIDKHADVRIHAMRIIGERTVWNSRVKGAVVKGLGDQHAQVRRAAASTLSRHSDSSVMRVLLDAVHEVGTTDPHLRQTLRIALRDQMSSKGALGTLQKGELNAKDQAVLASVALAVRNEEAAAFLIQSLENNVLPPAAFRDTLTHAVRYLPATHIDTVVRLAQKRVPHDLESQMVWLTSIRASLIKRGSPPSPALADWGTKLANELFASIDSASSSWGNIAGTNLWGLEKRNCEDGKRDVLFLSSLPGGESKTGVLRSRPFAIPEKLEFFLCGHLGFPRQPAQPVNFVQLRLAKSGRVIKKVVPPRNDMARRVQWDLKEFAGQQAFLEIVDGLAINAYAWLGVSRFTPAVVSVPQLSPAQVAQRQRVAAEIAGALKLAALKSKLEPLAAARNGDWAARSAACVALVQLKPDPLLAALSQAVGEATLPGRLRHDICGQVVARKPARSEELLAGVMKVAPTDLQRRVAISLASSQAGGESLLKLVEKGTASGRLLQHSVLVEQLKLANVTAVEARVRRLTANLPAVNESIAALIRDRRTGMRAASPSALRGSLVFAQKCAACHQIRGKGSLVGPQLDGIGNRGLARLLEDLLDPNRNVDASFQTTVLALDSGKIVSGLLRRREGEAFVLADSKGKELVVPSSQVERRTKSKLSIMPENVAADLKPNEFYDLVTYLLSLRQAPPTPVAWRATQLDRRFRSEGVAVADVNRDGKTDVLVGELWYEAPMWKPHQIAPVKDYSDGARGYSNCFACFADDVNKDGWPDLIVVGFPGAPCHWFENPKGVERHWPKHEIWHSACNESPQYVALYRSGQKGLLMGWHPAGKPEAGQLAWFVPGKDPYQRWVVHPISTVGKKGQPVPGTNRFSHGVGAGDVDGDKHVDVLCTGGWWRNPGKVTRTPWEFHRTKLGPACAQMYTADFNSDGRRDVVSSSAHGFGIWLHRQQGEAKSRSFQTSDLFPGLVSQTHALEFADIDGDGLKDLVTGKRWWAHGPKGDVGADQPAILYWFQATRKQNGEIAFVPRVVHRESGVGTQFQVADVNGDGLLDIVTSNKRGVFVFQQTRKRAVRKAQ